MNTTYFLNLITGNLFGTKTTPSIPSDYYIGLSTTAPSIDGTGVTEPSSGNYSRVKLTNLTEPVDGVITNANGIEFSESSGSWGTISHFVIYDSASGGNLLIYGALSEPRVVEAATVMTIRAGTLTLSAKNPS